MCNDAISTVLHAVLLNNIVTLVRLSSVTNKGSLLGCLLIPALVLSAE